jgi:hypothetical protein
MSEKEKVMEKGENCVIRNFCAHELVVFEKKVKNEMTQDS